MLPQLYDKFSSWSDGGSVWLYSDTHFSDVDCLLMDPTWVSEDKQVKLLNEKIMPSDTFILLGDVGNIEPIERIRARKKILILGNHDKGASQYEAQTHHFYVIARDKNEAIKALDEKHKGVKDYTVLATKTFIDGQKMYKFTWKEKLFDEVYSGPLFIGQKILLSHEPVQIDFALNIHGHCHGTPGGQYDKYHYNVCSNRVGFRPVNLKDIIKSGALNKIDDIHRLAINKANERKEKLDK